MAVGLAMGADSGSRLCITGVAVDKGELAGNGAAIGVEEGCAGTDVSAGIAVASESLGVEVGAGRSAVESSEQAMIDTPKITQ